MRDESQPLWRLRLPGPRWIWWTVSCALIGLSLALSVMARTVPEQERESVRLAVRLSSLSWRLTRWAGLDQASSAKTRRQASTLGDLRSTEAAELFHMATATDGAATGQPLAEEVMAHLVATEQDALAQQLLPQIRKPSADLQTITVLLSQPATATTAAAERSAQLSSFGRGWSSWTRDRLRLRIFGLPGATGASSLAAELIERDRAVTATAMTLVYVVALVALWGLSLWLSAWLRAAVQRSRGQPPWEWLRRRYPGLPNDNPYAVDRIVPWLALAGWIAVQLAMTPLLAMPGLRTGSPFGVLMEAMVGLAAAQWAVTYLSPTRVPLLHAARLGGDPAIPLGRASTAALRVLAALLPTMAVASLLSALFSTEADRIHPVAGMLLANADPVTLSVVGIAAVVVAPLGEELLFRGLLYRHLRQRLGIRPAVWVSALVFAAMHGSPSQMLPYVVLGLAFALVYEWVGSLWASVILHSLWNLGTFVVLVCAALS